jgi:hypothetical protein
MSRTFAETDASCVKATSFTSEIAPELVPAGERALFMYAAPRIYVASILAGENSTKELHVLAPSRAQRMAARVEGLQGSGGDAIEAARAWACEMTSLESAAEQMQDRHLVWGDFDRMLGNMPESIAQVASELGFEADPSTVAAIANGPLMKRYSKALEFDYSPELRRELIAETQRHRKQEIDAALAMLHSAAEKSPLLARALTRAETNS